MGKPIKDRGIRWTESYGDKSAYLKEEMEKQVGPGSYFRWEGHDYTTGNDYYVVVSPGFSKKHGYHFFAGLRKMPADQGASGKKFKTQAEALSYAMRTWSVPRSATKPAKAYTDADIVNIPIVLEPQHEKSASSEGMVITSERLIEAMSMQGSGHVTSNFVPKAGKKTYPEELCWAYKLSPTMGFLSALYTRKRFMGTDVINMPATGPEAKVLDEFTGKYGKAPLAPLYATCEPPTQESFSSSTKRVDIDNPLVKVARDENGNIKSFDVKPPLRQQEDDSYGVVRWGDVMIRPTITLQPQLFHGPDIGSLWAQLGALGVGIPEDVMQPPKNRRKNSPVEIRLEVMPEAYEQMVTTISQFTEGKKLKMFPPVIGNQTQKDLVDIIAYHRQNNIPIDWNTPYYETMKMSGSQLMVYDNLGMPMGLKLARRTHSVDEAKSQSEEHSDEGHSYVLKDPHALMTETIFPGYEGPHDDDMTSPIVQFIGENLDKYHAQNDEPAKVLATDMLKRLQAAVQSMDNASLGALAEQAAAGIQKPMTRKSFSEAVALLSEAREEANRLIESGAASKNDLAGAQNRMKAAQDSLRPMLTAFRALASHNLVNIGSEHVLDSRTCAPEMRNIKSQTFDVDSTLLPTPGGKLAMDGQPSIAWKDHVPPFSVRAKKQKMPNGFMYAGRRYDPATGKYVYGPLPKDFNPYQQMSGMRVSVEDPRMYFPREDGSLYEIEKSVWTRHNPNSRGQAIPGEAYDVGMGPPKETSAKHGKHLLESRMTQDAFRAVMQKHRAKETGGIIKGVRRYKSAPLFNADPETNKDAYRYTTSKGREVDLGKNAEKRGQYVYFNDSADLMRMMMMRMGQNESDFGPFTPISSEDMRIAYDVMIEGVHYYRAVNHYNKLANTDVGRAYEAARDDAQIPANEKMSFNLFREGAQYKNNFDQAKYNYGRVCDACGKGDKILPEVVAEMQRALANPEEALSPKPGTLWTIEYSNDGQSWTKLHAAGPEGDTLSLFGSQLMAEMNAGLRDPAVMSPDVRGIVEQGMKVRVAPMQSESMTPHNIVDNKFKTRQSMAVMHKIQQYASGKTREELEFAKEDRYSNDYASPNDDASQIISLDSPPLAQAPAVPAETMPEPEPETEPLPTPEDKITAPEPPAQALPSPAPVPAVAPAPEPPAAVPQQTPAMPASYSASVDRLIREWKSQGKSTDDMRARAKAHQGKPYFGDLMSAIDGMSGRTAASIKKLVALANRLDETGRASDADAIDRLVQISLGREPRAETNI